MGTKRVSPRDKGRQGGKANRHGMEVWRGRGVQPGVYWTPNGLPPTPPKSPRVISMGIWVTQVTLV